MLIHERNDTVFSGEHKKAAQRAPDGGQRAGMTKKGKKIRLLAALLVVLLLSGCAGKEASVQCFAMDTVMQLTAYGSGAERALAVAQGELARLDAELSAQRTSSEIAKLNASGVCENAETLEVLARALEIARRTQGAYDPTVYPLMQLWGFGTQQAHVPQQEQIQSALAFVGYEKLPDVSAPYSLPSGMAVDLGGIGKGFAAAKLRQSLLKDGVKSAVLSLGGNVTLLGSKPDGSAWTVGLQDPDTDGCFGYVTARDVSVVTSGGYQRYFEENGTRYWHILNAKTGWPAESGLVSATVVSRDDVLADGLSTALFVMGLEKAEAFWRESDDFEAVLLTDDGWIFVTQGLKDSFRAERGFEVITR